VTEVPDVLWFVALRENNNLRPVEAPFFLLTQGRNIGNFPFHFRDLSSERMENFLRLEIEGAPPALG